MNIPPVLLKTERKETVHCTHHCSDHRQSIFRLQHARALENMKVYNEETKTHVTFSAALKFHTNSFIKEFRQFKYALLFLSVSLEKCDLQL